MYTWSIWFHDGICSIEFIPMHSLKDSCQGMCHRYNLNALHLNAKYPENDSVVCDFTFLQNISMQNVCWSDSFANDLTNLVFVIKDCQLKYH